MMNRRLNRGLVRVAGCLFAGGLLLGGCHKASDADAPAPPKTSAATESTGGVALSPEQVAKLGLLTQPARAMLHSDEASGYGIVINHDLIAQAAAELATAQATAQMSHSALLRTQKLNGTPGAVSADLEEAATQKAAIDAAALTLTTQKLSSTFGMAPPWNTGDANGIFKDLAGGKTKLLRVTFPLGTLSGAKPSSLRASHLGAGKPGAGWTMNVIWDAPADAAVPGRSFFALLKGSDAGEGERLQVWTSVGAPVSGVLIPAAAAILSEGKYWCYVQKTPGSFVRIEIDTDKPVADGYFVSRGLVAGDEIVVSAAGLLLAKETGSAAEPD
jgi:hypothetical protein